MNWKTDLDLCILVRNQYTLVAYKSNYGENSNIRNELWRIPVFV